VVVAFEADESADDAAGVRGVNYFCQRAESVTQLAQHAHETYRTTAGGQTAHRFLIHDRDAIYAPVVEASPKPGSSVTTETRRD
jgi:hypothetical protein